MPANNKSRPMLIARIRARLFAELGGECAECGETSNLEINHIYKTKTYKTNKLNSYNRWLRYQKESKLGHLNLLCKYCNERYRPVELPQHCADGPF